MTKCKIAQKVAIFLFFFFSGSDVLVSSCRETRNLKTDANRNTVKLFFEIVSINVF